MQLRRHLNSLLPAAFLAAALPCVAGAQSGKWTATVPQLTVRGAADITIEKRNDKQSKAKISLRNGPNDRQFAWDIVAGRCGEEGVPIAPQAAFRQLRTGFDGMAEATSNIPLLESGKLYYVRVFDPASAPTDRGGFGCANISEKP